jgi:hypothetical protein
MADGNSGGGNTFLAFLVGGLIVVVAVLGYFMMSGHGVGSSASKSVDVNISAPKVSPPKVG